MLGIIADVRKSTMDAKFNKEDFSALDDETVVDLLELACTENRLDLIKHMLQRGLDINRKLSVEDIIRDEEIFTHPTCIAVDCMSNNDTGILCYLLEQGADINNGYQLCWYVIGHMTEYETLLDYAQNQNNHAAINVIEEHIAKYKQE